MYNKRKSRMFLVATLTLLITLLLGSQIFAKSVPATSTPWPIGATPDEHFRSLAKSSSIIVIGQLYPELKDTIKVFEYLKGSGPNLLPVSFPIPIPTTTTPVPTGSPIQFIREGAPTIFFLEPLHDGTFSVTGFTLDEPHRSIWIEWNIYVPLAKVTRHINGAWNIKANGAVGVLTFKMDEYGALYGSTYENGSDVKPLQGSWDEKTNTLIFSTRDDSHPSDSYQVFTGTLAEDGARGKFVTVQDTPSDTKRNVSDWTATRQ